MKEDPGLAHAAGDCLKTALHWAAEKDHDVIARLLLDAGADMEATTSRGATSLDWAASIGYEVADLLLARGARGLNVVAAAAIVMSYLITIYPSASGARVTPVEVLRYE